MVTGSRELIREMNRRLVLETVINDGPLSRAAIQKNWDSTKATISAIVPGSAGTNNISKKSEATRLSMVENRSCYSSVDRMVILSPSISAWNAPC